MVYFIISKTDNLVKIGYSANPQRRLKQLIYENKKPLEIYNVIDGDMSVERYFHDKHKDFHVKGEWFDTDLLILNDYDVCYDEDLLEKSVDIDRRKGKKQIAYYATPELKKDIDDCSLYEDVSITVFIDQAVKAKVKKVKKMMGNR